MEADRSTHTLADLKRNLFAGLRLASGRRVDASDFIVSFDQALLLILLLTGLELLLGYAGTESPARFSSSGLNHLGAAYLFDLMLVLLIARLAGADLGQTGGLLIANLAVSPLLLLVMHLLPHFSAEFLNRSSAAWSLWLLPIAWQIAILVRMLRLFLSIRIPRALSLALLNIVLAVSSLWFLPRSALWYSEPSASMSDANSKLFQLSVEDLFYDQPVRMQNAIENMTQQRAGKTDLYLLAMGGYGLEKVFLNEVEYVRQLFDERFDTERRSLVLVNNVEAVDRYPLANQHNLRQGLLAIGQLMNPDEDLLFLFMTSHGSRNHRFSVSFGPVPLDDLSPQQVRQALDDAGIRWRVILVSSCYSGGFIEALKDPHTLVITAAAQDRQSFGCGAASEFTDFGTAYFKHALAQSSDFIQAFDLASDWIQQKEQREGRKASQPQRFVGEAIAQKLALLEPAVPRGMLTADDRECDDRPSAEACRP